MMSTTIITSNSSPPPPPPPMISSPESRIRSFRKLRYDSLERIRAIYRLATKSFLLNHHTQVWRSISLGLEDIQELLRLPIHPAEQDDDDDATAGNVRMAWWLVGSSDQASCIDSTIDQQLLQLDRKFQILKITFLTSILQSSSASQSSSSSSSLAYSADQLTQQQFDSLSQFLNLNDHPHRFLLRLLHSILTTHHHHDRSLAESSTKDDDRLLHQLHPSILTALALASIKLGTPESGRQLIEAWFSSIGSFQLTLSSSSSSSENKLAYSSDHSQPDHQIQGPLNLSSDLRASYLALIQIYTIHILGALHQWPAALQFIHHLKAALILPPENVHNLIEAINTAKAHQSLQLQRQQLRHEEKLSRQAQLPTHPCKKASKKTSSSSNPPPSASSHSKPRPSSLSTTPPTPIHHHRPSSGPTTTGFSGFRTHLANFVKPHPSTPHHHQALNHSHFSSLLTSLSRSFIHLKSLLLRSLFFLSVPPPSTSDQSGHPSRARLLSSKLKSSLLLLFFSSSSSLLLLLFFFKLSLFPSFSSSSSSRSLFPRLKLGVVKLLLALARLLRP
ncbi:hypothetical protein PGT21_007909 [Puccinia graminis f. sp. tritici]|uniref:Uncharacterized protein n=1 Tax=Puccinia graminis f. sp. tritici TaxID=56615 RepID=A0A5B0LQ03_PUCGR|nr:hypothetical protein PGTUg99_006634 [Puccinia graminis f. sp. tritici]KAA1065698.1 hypothetical protein PGT21_007909 [Puccinia graminis f. sp. tritici]